jgi:hypothetical protein
MRESLELNGGIMTPLNTIILHQFEAALRTLKQAIDVFTINGARHRLDTEPESHAARNARGSAAEPTFHIAESPNAARARLSMADIRQELEAIRELLGRPE